MRLDCPNCDAQYMVDDAAIPGSGRDVQCSNCDHAWFQMPLKRDAEAATPATAPTGPTLPAVEDDGFTLPAMTGGGEARVRNTDGTDTGHLKRDKTVAAPRVETGADGNPEGLCDDEEAATDAPPPASMPARRALDEDVLAILREEAAREAALRRIEAAGNLETQADLGLVQAAPSATASRAVRERLAQLPVEGASEDAAQSAPDPVPGTQPDALPESDDMNATLHATEHDRAPAHDPVDARGTGPAARGGFQSGFSLVMLIVVLGVAAYVGAPKIVNQLPAARGVMAAYVTGVNEARVWLDETVQSVTDVFRGPTGQQD